MSDTHDLLYSLDPRETVGWLKERGYTALITSSNIYGAGVIFAKGNGTVRLAKLGDRLVWDGKNVKVESA